MGQHATVGITGFAAEALGDVVFVELPAVGDELVAGEACGELESTKSVSQLYAPVDGIVTDVNQEALDDPGVINLDPFSAGWLFRITVTSAPELLTADAYEQIVRDA